MLCSVRLFFLDELCCVALLVLFAFESVRLGCVVLCWVGLGRV